MNTRNSGKASIGKSTVYRVILSFFSSFLSVYSCNLLHILQTQTAEECMHALNNRQYCRSNLITFVRFYNISTTFAYVKANTFSLIDGYKTNGMAIQWKCDHFIRLRAFVCAYCALSCFTM